MSPGRCAGAAGLAIVALLRLAVTPGGGAQESAPRIAITIDDLPWNGPLEPQERAAATERLLSTLSERGVQAAGFANCGRVPPGAPLLRLWREHGMTLGNHSERHRDLNDAPLAEWLADVRSCDARLRELTGGSTKYFRYPFLHQGPTVERQAAALELLQELGLEIAHVSVDNSEWMLSRPYEAALRRGDTAEARRIGDLLIEHILRTIHHAQDVARRKVGRDVDHLLLLHATLLVSDKMGTLLDTLAADGFLFVSIEQALGDPVYALPDGYTGPSGLSWLYRMEPASPEDAAWDRAEAERLREALSAGRDYRSPSRVR